MALRNKAKVNFVHLAEMEENMNFSLADLTWIREPKIFSIQEDGITIQTDPGTDLWQRTYYGFQNDNAPVLQMWTEEQYFSFVVKTEFDSKHRFDQCGIVMYLDSDNWLKASIEYENDRFQRLGSVVTNHGYSDWATTDIDASIKSMWYRFSRRESDYCIECSQDGTSFKQMRICHMWEGAEKIRFGIYACSPEDSSFEARFSHMELTDCKWLAHE
jgi:regulation of enolase protein 1 (concanavalin A-like superfamily)